MSHMMSAQSGEKDPRVEDKFLVFECVTGMNTGTCHRVYFVGTQPARCDCGSGRFVPMRDKAQRRYN